MQRKMTYCAALATALVAPTAVFAQAGSNAAGPAGRPRTESERVNTEAVTPPPVNSDYRRAAEGVLPVVPGQVPAPVGGAIDPAFRGPLGGAIPTGGAAGNVAGRAPIAAMPAGLDAAMLVEHAVAMGIDGSLLGGLAAAKNPDEAGNDAVKMLQTRAGDLTRASKELMSKAASAGNNIEPNSPVRRFYAAANEYIGTLAKLSEPGLMASPNNAAEMAAINYAVKSAMEANHINHFGGHMGAPSPAMDGLVDHAKLMKADGVRTLGRIAGNNPLDPSAPMSPVMLAQRGRELVDALDALSPMVGQAYGAPATGLPATGALNGVGPNPGRFQDGRPEIIGGTYGTGSQATGTANGIEASRNVQNSTPGPNGTLNVPTPDGRPGSGVSGYGVGNNNTPPTQSTAGSRPR